MVDPLRVTLAVLVGGASTRMGRDKSTLPLPDGPLAGRAVAALGPLASHVLLCGRPVPGVPGRVVVDRTPGLGPLGGLAMALEAATTPLLLVCAGDMPGPSAAVAGALLDLLEGDLELAATVAHSARGLEPFPSAWRVAAAGPVVERALAAGERALRAVLRGPAVATLGADRCSVLDPLGSGFANWNTPADVASGGRPTLPPE